MSRLRRMAPLCVAAALLLLPACTLFDFWPDGGLSGSPFTPDQPAAAVTLAGKINSDPITDLSAKCADEGGTAGGTVFWGTVTNTGDLNVTNVRIFIQVFDAAGASLGTYPPASTAPNVFNGEIDAEANPEFPAAGTSLNVEQPGSFSICTPVPFGSAAKTEYQTSFIALPGTPE